MGQPLDTLRRWEDSNLPTFDQLGGEAAIFAERDEILACDAARVVGVLCASWAQIDSKTDAIEFLMQTVKTDDVYDADDVLDVILTSELALPDLAEPLTNFLREASCREGTLGSSGASGQKCERWSRGNNWTRCRRGCCCCVRALVAGKQPSILCAQSELPSPGGTTTSSRQRCARLAS